MKKLSGRSAYYLPAVACAVLVGLVTFGVPAGAGTSSPANAGEAFASLLHPALTKSGKLSPRLQQLSQPANLTASTNSQAAAVGLPSSGPGSLLRAAGGKQLLVYVRVSGSVASASAAIENAGATIVDASKRYGVMTVAVSPSRLQALEELTVVAGVREALAPMRAAACPSGNVVSEGDSQLAAASARSTYGVDGSGVTVGILSDSYDALVGASTGVSAGELPGLGNPCPGQSTPVSVLQDDITSSNTDEGRAMLEVVHDLAPRAPLAFATANTGIYGMADNIRALRSAGAKVIADDVTYYDEPMFQEGPIDVAVDDVTSSGASYFSSAGNENVFDSGGHNVGSYEAPAYRPTPCPAELVASALYPYLDCHDFDPTGGTDSRANYTLGAGGELALDLQWAEPWGGVGTDLDVYLIDAATGAILSSSVDPNPGASGTQVPFELVDYQNTGAAKNVEVVIARFSGVALPRLKYVLMRGSHLTSAEYNTSSLGDVVGPTIFGHNGGQNTITMAAVRYNNSTTPEQYSSHGPVTYYFGPVNGTTPAAVLSSPLVLSKPDIAATDCAATSFFYPPAVAGIFRFCGTSEAAPHAAAVAALMLQRDPAIAPAEVRARLKTTAHAVGGSTSDVVGSGLIDALGSVGISAPTLAFSQPSYSISEAGVSATITINRTGATSGAVSVHIATANGTATAGPDYAAVSQDLNFAAGETSKSVSVPIIDAGVIGGSKTVALALSNPSAGAELGWPSTATLTITDDDRAIAFSAAGYSVDESGGSANITIIRSGPTSSSDTVHFATANGTAAAGSDYTAVSQNVSFAAGEISTSVSIPIIDIHAIGGSKTVSLALSSPSSGAILGSPSSATLSIVYDDAALAFSSAGYSVNESSGSATITVKRTGLTSSAVSAHFATVNGTATAGTDFAAVSQTVSFASGVGSKTVTVPITDDKVIEGKETLTLTLSSPSMGAALGSPSAATLTIIDSPGRIISAGLTKKSFKRSQARRVKLVIRFSPASVKFRYRITFKKGSKWLTVRDVRKTGGFAGVRTYTARALFAGKPIKRGSYRLKLTADANSKVIAFRIT